MRLRSPDVVSTGWDQGLRQGLQWHDQSKAVTFDQVRLYCEGFVMVHTAPATSPLRKSARAAALTFLDMFWIGRGTPVDPIQIAKSARLFTEEFADKGNDIMGLLYQGATQRHLAIRRETPRPLKRVHAAMLLGAHLHGIGQAGFQRTLFAGALYDDAGQVDTECTEFATEFAMILLVPPSELEGLSEDQGYIGVAAVFDVDVSFGRRRWDLREMGHKAQ